MVIFISVIHFIYLGIVFILGNNLKIIFFHAEWTPPLFTPSTLLAIITYDSWFYLFVHSFIDLNLLNIPKLIFSAQVELVVQNPPANAGDMRNMGLIPGLERPLGGVHGNLLQDSCLEMLWTEDQAVAQVHSVAKSQTWLKWFSQHAYMHSNLSQKKKDKDFNTTCREPQITR